MSPFFFERPAATPRRSCEKYLTSLQRPRLRAATRSLNSPRSAPFRASAGRWRANFASQETPEWGHSTLQKYFQASQIGPKSCGHLHIRRGLGCRGGCGGRSAAGFCPADGGHPAPVHVRREREPGTAGTKIPTATGDTRRSGRMWRHRWSATKLELVKVSL